MEFISKLFDVSDYPARWHCGNWSEFEGWLHIASDTMIFLAYFFIPIILFYYKKTVNGHLPKSISRIIPYFMAFIFTCGTSHLFDAVMFYYPAYRFLGTIKMITAIVSWAAVIMALPSVSQILKLQDDMDHALEERDAARQSLIDTNMEIRRKLKEVEESLNKEQRLCTNQSN